MNNYNLILDIAMNLSRIGNWAADGYEDRKDKIITFLDNTSGYIKQLDTEMFPVDFKNTWEMFSEKYQSLSKQGLREPEDSEKWAEEMMTWGNILTHRAKLLIN
jgi:hypothetical protein